MCNGADGRDIAWPVNLLAWAGQVADGRGERCVGFSYSCRRLSICICRIENVVMVKAVAVSTTIPAYGAKTENFFVWCPFQQLDRREGLFPQVFPLSLC